MFQRGIALSGIFLLISYATLAQRATISGLVRDEKNYAIEQVIVAVEGSDMATQTNGKGYYSLQVPANKQITVVYAFPSYELVRKKVNLKAGETLTWDITLKVYSHTITDVYIHDESNRGQVGLIPLDISVVNEMVSPVGGIEALIKTYVGTHNELTSQYSVRGGNYDENLVYVNDFEIYRPFLVRSGQQEGLSFVNPDLVSNVNFSIGGFQAKYGNKMASVLDVTYKRPQKFAGSVVTSLLGANVHLEGRSENHKLTYLIGARLKSNQYILQAQATKGVYNPSFTDVQGLINYRFNDKWEIEAIGNYARNRFTFYPERQTSSFGALNQAYQLDVFYDGSEIDQFDSRFGGLALIYRPTEKLKFKLLASGFQTNEFETFDIGGEYLFGELETDLGKKDFGQIKTYLGTGIIHDYARNYLDVNVGNVGFRGSYDARKHFLSWGADFNMTQIDDALHEWERRDSSGFTQPYIFDTLRMAYFYHSTATFNYDRVSGFIQDNFRFSDSVKFTGSVGVRFNYSSLNNELIISPRLQLAYRPEGKKDIVFKCAAGMYAQPPFYREMRDLQGNVNTNLKAQKSYHLVLGADYNFKMYNRPFKLTAEFYYKGLWDIDPYYFDNVRIRYEGKNDAEGRIFGGEMRLYGDLVKNATSWVSIGLLQAEQKLLSIPTDYFPLPTDQRFMLGMYFEDYLPRNKNFKMHLSGIYTTGLPTSPQSYNSSTSSFISPNNTYRLPDYKRVDIGFSALLLDASRKEHPAYSFFNNIKSIWASIEVFNLLGIQNTLSYTWIQDQTSNKVFAVPNRLTSRLINVKFIFRF